MREDGVVLIIRFSGIERYTHCIAEGVGYLLAFSMRMKGSRAQRSR